MNRTRALVLIGGFMLALAVLAALEIRKGKPVSAGGHMVTGTISKKGPVELSSAVQPAPSQVPKPVSVASAGVDAATLRAIENNATAALSTIRKGDPSPQPGAEKNEKKEAVGATKASEAPEQVALMETGPVTPEKQETLPSIKKPLEPSKAVSDKTADPSQKKPTDRKEVAKEGKVAGEPVVAADEKANQKTVAKSTAQPQKSDETSGTDTAQPAAPLVMTTKAPDRLSGSQKAITRTRLELGKNITFRLTGAAPLKAKTLLLSSPDRYVVDLQGSWGIVLPKVPKNLLLNGIRVGQRETATRLVFELKRKPQSAEVVTIDATTLEVRIR